MQKKRLDSATRGRIMATPEYKKQIKNVSDTFDNLLFNRPKLGLDNYGKVEIKQVSSVRLKPKNLKRLEKKLPNNTQVNEVFVVAKRYFDILEMTTMVDPLLIVEVGKWQNPLSLKMGNPHTSTRLQVKEGSTKERLLNIILDKYFRNNKEFLMKSKSNPEFHDQEIQKKLYEMVIELEWDLKREIKKLYETEIEESIKKANKEIECAFQKIK